MTPRPPDTDADADRPDELGSLTVIDEITGAAPGPELLDYDDPAAQVEMYFLCSLMWADAATARTAIEHVRSGDFYRPAARTVFSIIAAIIAQNDPARPHTPVAILGELRRRGDMVSAAQMHMTITYLTDTTTAGSPHQGGPAIHGAHALGYAAELLAIAYRRLYRTAGEAITDAADTLPEHELFECMARYGRAARDLRTRLDAARSTDTPITPRDAAEVPDA